MVTDAGLIDVVGIRAALFADPIVLARLARSYGLDKGVSGAAAEQALAEKLGPQTVFDGSDGIDDSSVFHAAVWAVASNSRPWHVVHHQKQKLRDLLYGYDPKRVARLPEEVAPRLKALLPGLTSTRDTDAILAWASYLSGEPRYHENLWRLREHVAGMADAIADPEANILTAVAIAWRSPERVWPECRLPKTPGMGPVLASEFLRNLGWSMCKPDRHVGALLDGWLGTDATLRARSDDLTTKVCKTRDRSVRDYVYRSMLMIDRQPEGITLFELDQLVWLYGSMAKARAPKAKCAD